MPAPFVRFSTSIAIVAFLGAGCTSSGLSGGGGRSDSSKNEDSGKSDQGTGSTSETSTDTDHEVGGNDAGDFAFPEDVSGAYLTCQYAASLPGSAQFGCRVFSNGVPDQRPLAGVTQGTLLGAGANTVATMTAAVDPNDAGRITVTLSSNGNSPEVKPVEFGLSLAVAFADGTASTLESPFKMFLPDILFGDSGCPPTYVGEAKTLVDGRTFKVCTAASGGGGSIEAMWTRLPGTDASDYAAVFVPADASDVCDYSQEVPAPFTECSCDAQEEWIKGTIALPTNGNPFAGAGDICFVVRTQTEVFGKVKTIFSSSH